MHDLHDIEVVFTFFFLMHSFYFLIFLINFFNKIEHFLKIYKQIFL